LIGGAGAGSCTRWTWKTFKREIVDSSVNG